MSTSRQTSVDGGFEGESPEQAKAPKALEKCRNLQMMIDISAKTLHSLRAAQQSNPSIQASQALREAETKLVKMFSQQILSKTRVGPNVKVPDLANYPNTEQWLQVVGLPEKTIKGFVARNLLLDQLLQKSPDELSLVMTSIGADPSETSTLNRALGKLKAWTESQKGSTSGGSTMTTSGGADLFWTESISLSSCSKGAVAIRRINQSANGKPTPNYVNQPNFSQLPRPTAPVHRAGSTSSGTSVSSSHLSTDSQISQNRRSPKYITGSHVIRKPQPIHNMIEAQQEGFPLPGYSSPPTPHSPQVLLTSSGFIPGTPHSPAPGTPTLGRGKSRPNTPPPDLTNKVNQPSVFDFSRLASTPASFSDHPSTPTSTLRSYSHESHLSGSLARSHLQSRQGSINEDESSSTISSSRSDYSSLWRAQHTGPALRHKIEHKFETKHLKPGRCDLCKQHIKLTARVCKYCKYKCHKQCEKSAPLYSCGLSNDMIEVASKYMDQIQGSPLPGIRSGFQPVAPSSDRGGGSSSLLDSASSASSFTSSSPSSPHYGAFGSAQPSPANQQQFNFPQPSSGSSISAQLSPLTPAQHHIHNTSIQNASLDRCFFTDKDKLTSTNSTIESEGTVINSHGTVEDSSGVIRTITSDRTVLGSNSSGQTIDEPSDHLPMLRQPSLSKALEEWDIPYAELIFDEQLSAGHVGSVHKGRWHGPVAIKKIPIDPDIDIDGQLIAFKQEIAILKKTRHDNIVLFMGACMKPPELAIVTSFVTGKTLHTETRQREKWNLNKITNVALQTAHGMGYLHSKDIVHKHLTSNNIFLERQEKVIITDFGLSHVSRLNKASSNGLTIQRGWLMYVAPELLRSLRIEPNQPINLPFDKSTDAFAFGTLWWELLTGTWPFSKCLVEAIVWQVGNGVKPPLHNLHYSREAKEVLMQCWMFESEDRPNFTQIISMLEKLPKRQRLARSQSSYPQHLCRSIDSFF